MCQVPQTSFKLVLMYDSQPDAFSPIQKNPSLQAAGSMGMNFVHAC